VKGPRARARTCGRVWGRGGRVARKVPNESRMILAVPNESQGPE
jgi:hypothetical protein